MTIIIMDYHRSSSIIMDRSMFGSLMATVQQSIDSIDSYMEDFLTGSTSKQFSLESEYDQSTSSSSFPSSSSSSSLLHWLRPPPPSIEMESVLRVPRVLVAILSWLEERWSSLDMSTVCYRREEVLSTLEYFWKKDVLPDTMDASVVVCKFVNTTS